MVALQVHQNKSHKSWVVEQPAQRKFRIDRQFNAVRIRVHENLCSQKFVTTRSAWTLAGLGPAGGPAMWMITQMWMQTHKWREYFAKWRAVSLNIGRS